MCDTDLRGYNRARFAIRNTRRLGTIDHSELVQLRGHPHGQLAQFRELPAGDDVAFVRAARESLPLGL